MNGMNMMLMDREDGLLAVEELVMEIVHKASEIVYKHHMQRRVVPFAVQRAKADLLSVVDLLMLLQWLFLQHDSGCNTVTETESDEPTPCPVDSWARGVLTCTHSFHKEADITLKNATLNYENEQGTTINGNSVDSTITSNHTRHTSPANKLNTKQISNQKISTVKKEINSTPGTRAGTSTASSGLGTGWSSPPTRTSNIPPNSRSKSDSKQQDTKKSSREAVVPKESRAKLQEDEAEKFAKFKREIRGRDYFYDHNGNIIIMNQMDYDKQSTSSKVNMKVLVVKSENAEQLQTDRDITDIPRATSTSPTRFNKSSKKQRDQSSAVVGSPPSSNAFYKEIKLAQPSLLDGGNTIKVSPGVTLHPVEKKKETSNSPLRPGRKKEPQATNTPAPPSQPHTTTTTTTVQRNETLPAINSPTYNTQHQPTLTLSPTTLYGSTQKMWTTEMLADNFNALLPSIKPRTISNPSVGHGVGFT